MGGDGRTDGRTDGRLEMPFGAAAQKGMNTLNVLLFPYKAKNAYGWAGAERCLVSHFFTPTNGSTD